MRACTAWRSQHSLSQFLYLLADPNLLKSRFAHQILDSQELVCKRNVDKKKKKKRYSRFPLLPLRRELEIYLCRKILGLDLDLALRKEPFTRVDKWCGGGSCDGFYDCGVRRACGVYRLVILLISVKLYLARVDVR